MLNYIALYVIDWLTKGAWQDPESKGYPKIARFDLNAWLDSLGGVQIGWLIGLVLVVLVFIYLKYTKQGYEITVVSDSHATARYAGMSPSKIMIRTMFFERCYLRHRRNGAGLRNRTHTFQHLLQAE
mgnify:CR=1 FL=1